MKKTDKLSEDEITTTKKKTKKRSNLKKKLHLTKILRQDKTLSSRRHTILTYRTRDDIKTALHSARERTVDKFGKPFHKFYRIISGQSTANSKILPPTVSMDEAITEMAPMAQPEIKRSNGHITQTTSIYGARKRIVLSPERIAANRDKKYPYIFDSHFHVENYVHQGISVPTFLNLMDRVGVSKAVLFGLPLRQTVLTDEQMGGNYYTDSDLPLYYYSGTDYFIAEQYRFLSASDKERLYPMITGINPVDVGAIDDIMRLLQIFPKTFVGIGELTVHKEIVTAKIAGEKPALYSKGLNKIFDFAGDVGLVCLLHNDIDTMMAKDDEEMPRYYEMLLHFFQKHPYTNIIWAHCGLGRYVAFDNSYLPLIDKILATCPNVNVDISWDEVAKYVVKNSDSLRNWAYLICKYPDRFLFGSDLIAPKPQKYIKTFNLYKPLLDLLPEEVALKVLYTNAEAIFDKARRDVYAWSEQYISAPEIIYEHDDTNNPLFTRPVIAE